MHEMAFGIVGIGNYIWLFQMHISDHSMLGTPVE